MALIATGQERRRLTEIKKGQKSWQHGDLQMCRVSVERPSKRKEKDWGATHNEKHRETVRDEENDVGLREL